MVEYGYARVSTLEQDVRLQLDALIAAGVPAAHVYVDQASGTARRGASCVSVDTPRVVGAELRRRHGTCVTHCVAR